MHPFDSLTDLQSSQTQEKQEGRHIEFDSLTNLQSSQTPKNGSHALHLFDSLTDLQSSQTTDGVKSMPFSLIPLLIYKALKRIRILST